MEIHDGLFQPGHPGARASARRAAIVSHAHRPAMETLEPRLLLSGVLDYVSDVAITRSILYADGNAPSYEFNVTIDSQTPLATARFQTPGNGAWHYITNYEATGSGFTYWYTLTSDLVGDLAGFGDGTYTLSLDYGPAGAASTQIWFGIPGTGNPLPQPVQQPIPAGPTNGRSDVPSDTKISWQHVQDAAVNNIDLHVEDLDTDLSMLDTVLANTSLTSSAVLNLPLDHVYQADIAFASRYEDQNADGVSYTVAKLVDSRFIFNTYTGWLDPIDHVSFSRGLDKAGPADPGQWTFAMSFDVSMAGWFDSARLQAPSGVWYPITVLQDEQNDSTWSYTVSAATQAGLSAYGDGWYTLWLDFGQNITAATSFWFGLPDSGNPVPTPTDQPNMLTPADDATLVSPRTPFTWTATNDANVNAISLDVLDAVTGLSVIDQDFAGRATTTYAPSQLGLSKSYRYKLAFSSRYQDTNSDNIAFEVRKYTLTEGAFATAPTDVNLTGQLISTGLHANVLPGNSGNATLTLTNSGLTPAVGTIRIDLYFSGDQALDEGDLPAGSRTLAISLAGGKSTTVVIKVKAPPTLTPGTYSMLAALDSSGAIVETSEDDNLLLAAGTSTVDWTFGLVDGRANVPLRVIDSTGTLVTFRLTGPGYGLIGGGRTFADLRLFGTSVTSTLTITTSGAGSSTSIGDLTAGPLKTISARTTSLRGDLTVDGSLAKLVMDDAISGSTLTIGPAGSPATVLNVTLDRIADMNFHALMPVGAFTATDWLDTDATPDQLVGATVNTLAIRGKRGPKGTAEIPGDFQANLTLAGDPARAITLGSVRVAGAILGGDWDISGNIGSVQAGSMDSGWVMHSDGSVASVKATGALAGTLSAEWFGTIGAGRDLAADISTTGAGVMDVSIAALRAGSADGATVDVPGGIKAIRVTEWPTGSLTAHWLGTMTVSGSRLASIAGDFGADLTLVGPGNPAQLAPQTLGAASIAGAITGGAWLITGEVGRIRAGSTAGGWSASITGNVNSLATTGTGNLSGHWTSNSLKSLAVAGKLTGWQMVLLRAPNADDARVLSLGSVSVRGLMENSLILSLGSIGTVSVAGMANSTVFAGVQDPVDLDGPLGQPDGLWDLPDPANDVIDTLAQIKSLTIRGLRDDMGYVDSFINSNIASGSLGTIRLAYATLDNSGTTFGLAGKTLQKLTYRQSTPAKVYTWPTMPQDLQDMQIRLP